MKRKSNAAATAGTMAAMGTCVVLIAHLFGCSDKSPDTGGAVSVATSAAPTALPSGDAALKQAFAAAMPNGARESESGGQVLQFEPKQLLTLSADGKRVALISAGSDADPNACHACSGLVRVSYLDWNGTAFTPPAKPAPMDIASGSWGSPPTWSLKDRQGQRVLRVESSYTMGGCVETSVGTYVIGADGVATQGLPKQSENCAADPGDGSSAAESAQ